MAVSGQCRRQNDKYGLYRHWTLLVITQNLLGNEQWRAVDSIKHCFSHSNNEIRQLKPFIKHLKAHTVEPKFSQFCYFRHLCWDTPSENTGLSHTKKNCQTCPVPLSKPRVYGLPASLALPKRFHWPHIFLLIRGRCGWLMLTLSSLSYLEKEKK